MKLIETNNQLVQQAKSVKPVWSGTNGKILNIQLRKGEEVAEHDADMEVLIIVRKGTVRFTVEGEPVSVTAETVLHMAPFEKHSLYAETDADVCVVQIAP
ncbi:cupin domain-containing protein [Sporosarcina trichiuri]|uniref:cupin domain-containing protein n=1 Tax=Sporosarcina trichiuri TaxID=3056445 RepID=UPI0025B4E7E3|nr:cupin domain-containing protein [Sporosarcina sp. 0.2-SM1T-5]WJY27841.1 AraC family ligand binding domain-containing protein [Sporosarcina sp. 0.2-SM1T-5]